MDTMRSSFTRKAAGQLKRTLKDRCRGVARGAPPPPGRGSGYGKSDRSCGRRLLGRLIERADVVLDNYKAGTLARWGFDDAWFDAHAPRAIRASVTGYGSSGPNAAAGASARNGT